MRNAAKKNDPAGMGGFSTGGKVGEDGTEFIHDLPFSVYLLKVLIGRG